jgi:hypothetical protein
MKKPFRTQVLTQLKQSEDLGIDAGKEWQDAVIDLGEVESFFNDMDDDDNEITQLTFKSGHVFSVRHSFESFIRIMREGVALTV